MTLNVQTFPPEWYQFIVTQKYPLRSINQAAGRPWGGTGTAISSRPHTQSWTTDVSFAPLADHMAPELGPVLQDVGAFIKRARGRSGLIRMSWALRTLPWHDRDLLARHAYTSAAFSDGSTFTDGGIFINGMLPPEVQIEEAAVRGANYLVLSGFPPNTANVLRRDDFLEIKPGGVPADFPHLYAAAFGGDSDSEGRIGIEIEPRLRQGVNAGDTVSLRFASTVFHLADDNQGDIEASGVTASVGFSLVEALDMVP